MKQSLKDSHIFGIIGICTLALIFLWSQSSPQTEVATEVSSQPQTNQLAQTSNPSLALSPASQTIPVNTNFTINILLNTNGQNIYGVDLNKIKFNPAILQVQDAKTSITGTQIQEGALMSQVFVNNVDNTAGTIQFSQVADPNTTYCCSGTLATITFQGKTAGTSAVTFDFTPGSGIDSNIAGATGDILSSVGSGSYTITAPDTTIPSTPGTPVLAVISDKQINLTWTASTDNIAVTGYRVERCSGSVNCTTYAQIAIPAANSYNDQGLTASTIYRYRVYAVDAAGNISTVSGAANATTQPPPDTTPPTILNLAVPTITTNSATVTWNTNEAADTQVDYGLTTSYGLSTTLNATLSTSHTATLASLSAGTLYHYRVKSKDAAGNLNPPADQTFTTLAGPDTTIPNPPTNITANPTSETQVQLNWTAATDPIVSGQNNSGVVSYQVFRNNVQIGAPTTASYLDTGLTAGTSYSYQVAAVDGAGNISTKTIAVNATTPLLSQAVQRRVILNPEGAPATLRTMTGTVEFIDPANLNNKVYTADVTTNNLGQYTMNVPAGLLSPVLMRAVFPGYLTRLTTTNIDLRSSTISDVTWPQLLAGDFNNDKVINTIDFSTMNAKWGQNDPVADFNKDGDVNTLDFTFMSRNWTAIGE